MNNAPEKYHFVLALSGHPGRSQNPRTTTTTTPHLHPAIPPTRLEIPEHRTQLVRERLQSVSARTSRETEDKPTRFRRARIRDEQLICVRKTEVAVAIRSRFELEHMIGLQRSKPTV